MNEMTTPRKLNIAIVGAGLGGLTAAAFLLQQGHRVRVFEQAAALSEIGAGIQISANAARVLTALGVTPQLLSAAVFPEMFRFVAHDSGSLLAELPIGEVHEQQFGEKYLHLHRADLHAALTECVMQLDEDAVILDSRAIGFEEGLDSVTLRLASGESHEWDVLIGADGVRSHIRSCIMGPTEARFTGYSAWRATVPAARLGPDYMDTVCMIWLGRGAHAILYYLRRHELINFVGIVENDDWREESWIVKDDWINLKRDFSGWHDDVQRLIDSLPRDGCYRWALYNRPPTAGWSTSRATLLGDAAHATLPFMAQGAAMAIEDAAILARAISESESVSRALTVYEATRFQRTSRIQRGSNAMAELYRSSNSESFATGFSQQELSSEHNAWLYSYDPIHASLAH